MDLPSLHWWIFSQCANESLIDAQMYQFLFCTDTHSMALLGKTIYITLEMWSYPALRQDQEFLVKWTLSQNLMEKERKSSDYIDYYGTTPPEIHPSDAMAIPTTLRFIRVRCGRMLKDPWQVCSEECRDHQASNPQSHRLCNRKPICIQ